MDRTPTTDERSGGGAQHGAAPVDPVIEELADGPGTRDGYPAGWRVERATGTAQQLHEAAVDFARRSVRVHQLVDTALVSGSTQSATLVDRAAAAEVGVALARRRSGGGAVYLSPVGQVWLDVVVPAGDPLWQEDVGRASWWLGECWAATVAASSAGFEPVSPTVHRSGVSDRLLARIACFAALGPGEVGVAGRKIVGISQRRTRLGARFQCVAYTRWDPEPMLALLRMGDDAPEVTHALRSAAGPVPGHADEWSVVEDFLRFLP